MSDNDQARQTRPNSGGGGLQRASQDSTKGGCNNLAPLIMIMIITRIYELK